MRKRALLGILGLGVLALALAMPIAADTAEAPPPKKVWVCHFPGHEAPQPWVGAGTMLDGDYVVAYAEGMPLPAQIDYCESRGGELIEIAAVAAEKGHKAQLLDRIDGYPGR